MSERERLVATALEGYAPEVGAALWRLEEGRERTERLLAQIRPDEVDAGAGGNTVGTILYHLALIEADWLYTEILETEIPPEIAAILPVDDRDEAGILKVVRGESMDDHRRRLATIREAFREALRGLGADDFHRPRSLPNYDVSPAWVLHHLAQHEAEHRGEIGTVLAGVRG